MIYKYNHHEIEVCLRHRQDAADVFAGDDVKRQHVGGGGENAQLVVEGQH